MRKDNSFSNNFSPIGHIALSTSNEEARLPELYLPSQGIVWIKTLYVCHALQGEGIGRTAMDIVEEMAAKPPFSAKILALDTIYKDDQLKEEEHTVKKSYSIK